MSEALIPLANPLAQYRTHEGAIRSAVERVLHGGHYILGPEVAAFEEEFAAWCGVVHCIGVASGTDALVLALKGCGVRAGDEAITVSQTAVATVAAIELAGAIPVFCDIDPVSRCLDPARIEALITPQTRAIVPVHLYGQPADMPAICAIADRHGLVVVEDCAQAHGAMIGDRKVGSFGDAAAFSFYPTKNLGAIGDGGAVVTSSADVAEQVVLLRQYGWRERYISALSGMNSRLDELQAAILRVKLPFLDADNQKRRLIAAAYSAAAVTECFRTPAMLAGTTHAMHLYVLECLCDREQVMAAAAAAGIGTGLHYPQPVHRQPAYSSYLRPGQQLPVTERLAASILSLPMYPELHVEVERIVQFLSDFRVSGQAV